MLLDKTVKLAHRSDDFSTPTSAELEDVVQCVEVLAKHVGGRTPRAFTVLKQACRVGGDGAGDVDFTSVSPVCGILRILEILRRLLLANIDALLDNRERDPSYVHIERRHDGQSTSDIFTLSNFLTNTRSGIAPDVRRLLEIVKIFRHLATKAPSILTPSCVVGFAEVSLDLIDKFPSSAEMIDCHDDDDFATVVRGLRDHWTVLMKKETSGGSRRTTVLRDDEHDQFARLFDCPAIMRDVVALHCADARNVDCFGSSDCLSVAYGGVLRSLLCDDDNTNDSCGCCCCFRRPRLLSHRWRRDDHHEPVTGTTRRNLTSRSWRRDDRREPIRRTTTRSWRCVKAQLD